MTNKSILDDWEEQVRNMVYEVWTSHSSSKHMVELVGKLLQAQREKDLKIILGYKCSCECGCLADRVSIDDLKDDILNQNSYDS